MKRVYSINNIDKYNIDNNHKTKHPLVTVIDFSKANQRSWGENVTVRFEYGMYCVFLKDVKCGDIRYGRDYYDYQAGTLVFFSPGQVADYEMVVGTYQPVGHALVFHPDLLHGTALGKIMYELSFFQYQSNESLHISNDERQIVLDCFAKISHELSQPVDKHSKKLIASNIELFFNYCQRFYDRQFITREKALSSIVSRFEVLLNDYFASDQAQNLGLPSVAYFAEKLNLSANYFGDLIKKETGLSAKDYIQNKTIEEAKELIFDQGKTVNEIAYELGFKYPQHFSRLFKEKVGMSPLVWRGVN